MRRSIVVVVTGMMIAAVATVVPAASGSTGTTRESAPGGLTPSLIRTAKRLFRGPLSHSCNLNGVTCAEPFQSWEDFSAPDGSGRPLSDYLRDRGVAISDYIGHDEPSVLFYSNQDGAGYNFTYKLTVPTEPPLPPKQDMSGSTPGFMLRPAFWFGVDMCDDASAPNPAWSGAIYPNRHCAAHSDSNIHTGTDPNDPSTYIGTAPGGAFEEMQFYPPGWVDWPAGISCDADKWCAALNIDSLSLDENTNTPNNDDCLNKAGLEPVNFAFLTSGKTGTADTPADPLNGDRFTPGPNTALFNPGDQLVLRIFDTAAGLRVLVRDKTAHTAAAMVASASNGFASVNFDPNAPTCTTTAHGFHPMYATSSEQTRLLWTAHGYNVSYSDEIGHFEYCKKVDLQSPVLGCAKPQDGDTQNGDIEDDNYCLPIPGLPADKYDITGCLGIFGESDIDFDGVSYEARSWPGSYADHGVDAAMTESPLIFSSPTFLKSHQQYDRVAFEADLPRIESDTFGGVQEACQRHVSNPADPHPGQGCVKPPPQSAFYPTYSTRVENGECQFQEGGLHLPHIGTNFGGIREFGRQLQLSYPAVGPAVTVRINNFRKVLGSNPCPSP